MECAMRIRVLVFILNVLLPVGLVGWNFMFHPGTAALLTGIIIWLAAVSLFVFVLNSSQFENINERLRRLEKKQKDLGARIKQSGTRGRVID
jgi:hypothetical protein